MTLLSSAIILIFSLTHSFTAGSPAPSHRQRSPSNFHATLPIAKRLRPNLSKRQGSESGAIGLGDIADEEYSIQVTVGSESIPVVMDTGSSDLLALSSDCTPSACGSNSEGLPKISKSSLQNSGTPVEFKFGDSAHQTIASGIMGSATVSVAGLKSDGQFVAAVDNSSANFGDLQLSGIFGLSFPTSSLIFENLVKQDLGMSNLTGPIPPTPALTDAFISALPSQGPFLTRLAANGQLKEPMFTITLEREDIEVGGNVGQLTIGKLPDGVSNDSLTWVPVRLYTPAQGGLTGSTSNPNEVFPTRWEIPIDDVVLNGQTLPKPDLPDGYTALIDTGTSFLAGPQDTVTSAYNAISINGSSPSNAPAISCATPVDLTFVIGGKNFPIDPRDFLSDQQSTKQCNAGFLLPTDPPRNNSLESWVLGDPFMKSNLVAFYYGNLTHPSVDPPRIGFLSTVPSNANDLLAADVKSAEAAGQFITGTVSPPTTTFSPASTDSEGVGQAPTTVAAASRSAASPMRVPLALITAVAMSLGCFSILGH